MAQPDLQARVSTLERRVGQLADGARGTRELAAGADRDVADLTVKVEALRRAVNGLGLQTAARFVDMEARFDRVDARFDRVDARLDRVDGRLAEIRGQLGRFAGAQQQVVTMLTTLIERDERPGGSAQR